LPKLPDIYSLKLLDTYVLIFLGYLPAKTSGYLLVRASGYLPTKTSGYLLVRASGYLPTKTSGYLPAKTSGYPLIARPNIYLLK
jgi:hypothetical protein